MKQVYILIIISIFGVTESFAQLIQASLGAGTAANRVKVFIRPAATQTPANISTLQFNIGISNTITPKPTMTVVSSAFVGVTWVVSEANEGGFNNFQLTTATSPIQPNTTANTEIEVMELEFTGGPLNTANNVALVTLPDGGLGASAGNSLFLSTGSLQSNGSNLFHTRSGVTVNNQFSYDASGASSGTTTSTATMGGVILPVKWLDFSVARQQNNALVQWKVIGEENTVLYDLERSLNGRDFEKIATTKKLNGTEVNTYNHTDVDINKLQASIIYYRVKQLDREGQFTYSEVRTLKLNSKGDVSIYPNPVKDGFYIQFAQVINAQEKVQLQLVTIGGQIIETRSISASQASNYYFSIMDNGSIKSGTYLLKIYAGENLVDSKSILVQR